LLILSILLRDTPAFSVEQQAGLKKEFELLQQSLHSKPDNPMSTGAVGGSNSSVTTADPSVKPKRKRNNIWANVLTEQVGYTE